MTAPKGTPAFASERAIESEKTHRRIVKEVVQEFIKQFPDFSLSESISLDQIVGGRDNVIYGLQKNGEPSVSKPDGGVLCYKEEPVALMESKFQENTQNAFERVSKFVLYLNNMVLPPEECLFVSCYGPGFELQEKATSTGPQIDCLRALGVSCLENPTDEEFKEKFQRFLYRLKSLLENGDIERYRQVTLADKEARLKSRQVADKAFAEQQAQT